MILQPFYMGRIKKCVNDCRFAKCLFWYKGTGYCGRYFCYSCRKLIERGELSLRVLYPQTRKVADEVSKGKGVRPKEATVIFHSECYKEQLSNWIDYWAEEHHPKRIRKRGRPVKSSNPKEYRRLKASERYYTKAGNTDRVKEIKLQIKELEYGQEDKDLS